MKPLSKLNKEQLHKLALKMWQLAVIKRFGNQCAICGQPAEQIHHFIPTHSHAGLKYFIENGIPLCKKHHYLIHHSHNPYEIYKLVKQIIDSRDEDFIAVIETKFKQASHKWLKKDLLKVIDDLENYLNS